MTRDHVATTLKWFGVLAVVALLVSAALWRASGGRWYDVRTGSMGQAAPVGSLLLVHDAAPDELRVGDLVTFRVPDSGSVYTHRLHAVSAEGMRTKGDVNAAVDPWVIHDQDVVGKVSKVLPGAGFVLQGLPTVLLVFGAAWVVSLFLRARWRSPVRIAGFSLAFAVSCFLLQPWVGLARVDVTRVDGAAELTAVSTGLLPVRAEVADHPRSERIYSGQTVTVRLPADATKQVVNAVPSLTGWWWVGAIGFCALPLLWTLAVGVADRTGRRVAT